MNQMTEETDLDLQFDMICSILRKEGNHSRFCEKYLTPEVEKYMKNGATLLANAIYSFNIDMVQLLIKRQYSSLKMVTSKSDTILHLLGNYWNDEYKDLVISLLNNTDLITKTNKNYETFLHSYNVKFLEFVLNDNHITKDLINVSNNDGENLLFYLVRKENALPALIKCVEKGANIFQKNNKNETILDIAKICKIQNIIDYLMPLFENKSINDRFDYLSNCIRSQIYFETYKQSFTPDVEKYFKYNYNLLIVALECYNTKVVKFLLKRNNSSLIGINARDDTILHLFNYYWTREYQDLFISLLDNKPELMLIQNNQQQTFLHLASKCLPVLELVLNHKYITKELLNIQDIYQETCLFNLVRNKQTKTLPLLKLCIEKGANIFIKNKENKTIFDIAKICKIQNIIDYLIPLIKNRSTDDLFDYLLNCIQSPLSFESYKQYFTPEVEKYAKYNSNLLVFALRCFNTKVVKFLIERNNSSLISLNSSNDNILHFINFYWSNKYQDLFITLLDNKPELMPIQNTLLESFLHIVPTHLPIIKLVLNHKYITKELLNLQNNDQETFLFKLVRNSQTETVPLLKLCIKKGANILIKNKKSETILDIANRNRIHRQEIIDYLTPLFNIDNTQTTDDPQITDNLKSTDDIKTTDFKMYDHVQCISSGLTGVIISKVNSQYNCVTVAFNQPGLCLNILKNNLKKLPKALELTQSSFIYNLDLLFEGQLITDINQNRFIVAPNYIITNLADRQNVKYSTSISSGALFWVA